jgi:hypothetical protein
VIILSSFPPPLSGQSADGKITIRFVKQQQKKHTMQILYMPGFALCVFYKNPDGDMIRVR